MKARKRHTRPYQFPDGRPILTWVVVANGEKIEAIPHHSRDEVWRRAFWAFPHLDIEVYSLDDWEAMELERAIAKATPVERETDQEPAEPALTPEQSRIAYQRMKADYLSGVNTDVPEHLRRQFEAFRPRRTIGPLACECESSHRSKPIDKHKWRPLQTGFSLDQVAKVLEHLDDNDHDTA